MTELVLFFVSSDAPSVDKQPVVNLQSWRVLKLKDEIFLIGLTRETGKMRATSPVRTLNCARTATTSSGRVYHLEGPPGSAAQARIWPHFSDWKYSDITEAVLKHFHQAQ